MLSFNPLFPLSIAIIIVFSLVSFFGYREFRRKLKFLALRGIALSFVLVSLLGIILQPTYLSERILVPTLLLTRNYQKSKVDSILHANSKLKVIRTEDALSYSGSSTLRSWQDLSSENISYIIGQGIPEYAFDLLRNKDFQFIPAATPQGITRLIIPAPIFINDRVQIKGSFNSTEKTKLKLLGPGGAIDSTNLDIGESSFSLSFTPKRAGNSIYSLVSEGIRGSTSTERLPVEVSPTKRLRVLFIQKFPTAEVRFLKNFLSEKHHQIAVRYQVSKNNFTYEFDNLPQEKIDNLHSDILNSYDLLFIDQKSYNEISTQERGDLKKSINKGLGVIFLLHDAKEKAISEFLPVKTTVSSKDTIHIRLSSSLLNVLPALPIELANDPSIVPITKNKNRILSGYFYSGLGKIGFQFIQETFRIGLEGNIDDYSFAWTPLINNTARPKESNFKLKLVTAFPIYTNEPIDLTTISSRQPSLYAESVMIPLKENAFVEGHWTGRSWAGKSGWHQLYIKQDSTQLNYFVSDSSEWRALRISNQMKSNQVYQNISIDKSNEVSHQVPFPKLVFYFIFLFSSAFLWLAPKI